MTATGVLVLINAIIVLGIFLKVIVFPDYSLIKNMYISLSVYIFAIFHTGIIYGFLEVAQDTLSKILKRLE